MRGTSALNGASAVAGVSAKSNTEKRNARKGLIHNLPRYSADSSRGKYLARKQSLPCFFLLACRLKLIAGPPTRSLSSAEQTLAPAAGTFISCRLTDQGLRIIIQLKGNFDKRTREPQKYLQRATRHFLTRSFSKFFSSL